VKVLVTGGNGFLGQALVRELLARGHAATSASRRPSAELDRLGVRTRACDLRNCEQVEHALEDQDAVLHAAALTGIHGQRADLWRTNVEGTAHVLAACRKNKIARLVYTSSPSVCFDGRDQRQADESLPYAKRFLAPYPESKALAERAVLAANAPELATCALRPHLILGPGDPHLLPRLVERARRGRLPILGGARNEISFTWVENAAVAHVDALERLAPDAACAGRAYFIAQEEPVSLWSWLADLFTRGGVPPPSGRVPLALAYAGGAFAELAWKLLRRAGEPPMTRFLALQLGTSHSYDIRAAKRDLGYRERVTTAEATERLVADLRANYASS